MFKFAIKLFRYNKVSLLGLILLGLIPLLTSSTFLWWIIQHQENIQRFSISRWIFYGLAACIAMALALTPTTLLAIVTGFFLDWNSLWIIVPGYLIASWLGYRLSLLLDKGKFIHFLQQYASSEAKITKLRHQELALVIFMRLSPVFPFAISNLFFGWLKVSVRKLLLGSLIGMLPRTCLAIWIGIQVSQINELSQQENPLEVQLLLLFLLIISLFGLGKIMKKVM